MDCRDHPDQMEKKEKHGISRKPKMMKWYATPQKRKIFLYFIYLKKNYNQNPIMGQIILGWAKLGLNSGLILGRSKQVIGLFV